MNRDGHVTPDAQIKDGKESDQPTETVICNIVVIQAAVAGIASGLHHGRKNDVGRIRPASLEYGQGHGLACPLFTPLFQ
jgi:hypothetical protein